MENREVLEDLILDQDIKELYEYCKANLEIQKIPSVIEVADHIEKTYNGKIRRVGNE